MLFLIEKTCLTDQSTETPKAAAKPDPVEPEPEGDEPEPDTTLFVKNLNFGTADEAMRQHFEQCGSLFSAAVAKKKDPKNPGQFLSMGYGFVQFMTKNGANSALKSLQGSNLDGHVIELKVFSFLFLMCFD